MTAHKHSGEMARDKVARETRGPALVVEVGRRIALPVDQWEPAGDLCEITFEARSRLTELR